jgi:hypothetical protein
MLQRGIYSQPALPPASPWLDNRPPKAPSVGSKWDAARRQIILTWRAAPDEPIRRWLFQIRVKGRWYSQVLPASQVAGVVRAGTGLPEYIALTAIDRGGNASPPTVLGRR